MEELFSRERMRESAFQALTSSAAVEHQKLTKDIIVALLHPLFNITAVIIGKFVHKTAKTKIHENL